MTAVLVTGANGFVGKALCERLLASGFDVRTAVRSEASASYLAKNMSICIVGEINSSTCWQAVLAGIDVVIHLASRVHIMKETAADPLMAFREINVMGTENLARQTASQPVRRFIYLSSIKVNGEQTDGSAFCADDTVNPIDAYAVSKWEAEQVLKKISSDLGLDVVIIRPPLVYGPGVKGNFLRLIRLVEQGLPIPLAKVDNNRSMVNLDNLCDLIVTCVEHPDAGGEVFLVSDNQDLATPDLIRLIGKTLQRPARLLAFPVAWLRKLGQLAGKGEEVERLCGSLQIDIGKTRELLGWNPPCNVADGVKKTVEHYLSQAKRLMAN